MLVKFWQTSIRFWFFLSYLITTVKVIVFGVSVRKNWKSIFIWIATNQKAVHTYFDIWIDFQKMTLHKKDDF